jgi:bifunctional DNA-binding transcriptional regulator/antitoxin component of YhaV-PrlF toxin-antitoxin module
METTVTSKGQLTLPIEVRRALGIDSGTVFDQFVGLKARGAPYPSGDKAREALRVAEDEPAPYGAAKPAKSARKRR